MVKSMYQINLLKVRYPASVPAKIAEENQQRREQLESALKQSGKSEEEAREEAENRIPHKLWDAAKEFEDTIGNAISNWMQLTHFDKERKTVVAPWEVRKIAGKIQNKVLDAENGEFELSDEQMDFMLKVLHSDLPVASYFFYLGEYFDEVKLAGDKN